MQIHGADAAINLEAEQSLRIESRDDIEIVCLSGLLWVTQPGDARDLFVAPGEPLRLVPSGLTLVTAMLPSALRAREIPAAAGGRTWLPGRRARFWRPAQPMCWTLALPRDRSAGL